MSSGFGPRGTVSPCYIFWKSLVECANNSPDIKSCYPYSDDYLICINFPRSGPHWQRIYYLEEKLRDPNWKPSEEDKDKWTKKQRWY